MWNYNAQRAMQKELQSDLWIQRHVPGGLNSMFFRIYEIFKEKIKIFYFILRSIRSSFG